MEELFKQSSNTPIPQILCQDHSFNHIIKGCINSTCTKKSLLCLSCLKEDPHNEHPTQVIDLPFFIQQFSYLLEQTASQNRTNCQQFLRSKDNQDLFKAMHNQYRYVDALTKSVEAQKVFHIYGIKQFAIAQDMTTICENLQIECQNIKDVLFKQLDVYLDQYKENFRSFQLGFSNAFTLTQHYQYSNPPTLCCKVAREGNRANQFFASLKLKLDSNRNVEDIMVVSSKLTHLSNTAPCYKGDNNIQDLINQTSELMRSFLTQKVRVNAPIKRNNSLPQVQQQPIPVKQSQNIFSPPKALPQPIQSMVPEVQVISGGGCVRLFNLQKATGAYKFRPLKRYPLEFPVTSIMPVSNNAYTLTSKSDSRLYLFDRDNKKVAGQDAHNDRILWQERLETPNKPFNTLLTGGLDGRIIVWLINRSNLCIEKFKTYQMSQTGVQVALDMMNGGGFIAVDDEGFMGYYNPFTNEEYYPLNERFQGRGVKAVLLKPNEVFLTHSVNQEGGAVWKLIEQNGVRELIQSQRINQIPSAAAILPHSFSNNLILTSLTGASIFNLELKGQSTQGRNGNDFEYVSFENMGGRYIQYYIQQECIQSIIGIPQQLGSGSIIQIERKAKNLINYDIKVFEFKLDALAGVDAICKPRMRLFKDNDQLCLIVANSKQKELLVYEIMLDN